MNEIENNRLVKATIKGSNKKQLDFVLEILKKALGKQNINALSPNFIYRYQIYILDMDIIVPEILTQHNFDYKGDQQ